MRQSPTLSIAGGTAACLGSSLSLTASGASTYTWSNGSNSASQIIYPSSSGTIQAIGSATNGCTASATRTLSILPAPQISVTAGQSALCAGAAQVFTANGAGSYSWNIGGTGSVVSFSPQNTTQVLVTGTNSFGCEGSATITAAVLALPSLVLSSDKNFVCSGTVLNLSGSGASSYAWSNNLGSASTVTVLAQASTVYTLTGTGSNNCSKTLTISPVVYPTPSVSIANLPNQICKGEQHTLTASGASNYVWSNGVIGATNIISPSVTTTYTVAGSSLQNCSTELSFTVTVNECTSVAELNAIRKLQVYPNPTNGKLIVELTTAELFDIQIVNQIGALVLHYEDCENGKIVDLSDLPNGLYFLNTNQKGTILSTKIIVQH